MSGSLFSMVIMFYPLISRMLICIFLSLSIITIIFYDLFGIICHQWKVLPFGLVTAPRVSQPSLNLSCSFAITRISVLLSIWIISWSWFAISGQVRGLTHFCVLYWFALDYILIFPCLTCASLRHFVFGVCVGILCIYQYLCLLIT